MVLPDVFEQDYYTEICVTVEGAFELTCYTEEYDAWVDRAVERIEELEEERCTIRYAQVQEEGQEGLYRRYQEIHYQKGYTLAEIRRYIGQSGMEFLGAYDGYTRKAAEADSERILVAARERGKTL